MKNFAQLIFYASLYDYSHRKQIIVEFHKYFSQNSFAVIISVFS